MPVKDSQDADRSFFEAVSELAYCNPFSPERIRLERLALGDDFREGEPAWSLRLEDPAGPLLNGEAIAERVRALLPGRRDRITAGRRTSKELRLYEDAVLYSLYYFYSRKIFRDPDEPARADGPEVNWGCYADFSRDWRRWFDGRVDGADGPEHVFAIFYQMRRAFFAIYRNIIGGSPAAARLRAAVWQSIFTHDMRRYRRSLHRRMGDFSTLITGPSGTGKELVARAIALSRYIPFDVRKSAFRDQPEDAFHALNLAALSPTLIESELFGHRRGSFTGADRDRKGWLEICPEHGTVFLDEIGELDPAIQVKLLRVIQTRRFQRVGETTDREFQGKIIAATNRDLTRAMESGGFRPDFYYRLCSDLIETGSLADQLRESPETLRQLVRFMARRVTGEDDEEVAAEAERWIEANLGGDYAWPGNYRELEQCLRNILVRGEYRAPHRPSGKGFEQVLGEFKAGALSADEALRAYCTLVYSQTGSYAETARRLDLDHRTVKSKLDKSLLAELD